MRIFLSIIIILSANAISSLAYAEKPRISSQRFDDWHYRCVEAVVNGKKSNRCEVVQVAQTKQGENVINLLTVSFSEITDKKKKKQTVITVLAPLNVFLPAGLALSVDKNKASGLKYRNCNKAGCWIQHLVKADLLKQFDKGVSGFAKMRLINGQNINVKFSLKGLSSAMKALKNGKTPKSKG